MERYAPSPRRTSPVWRLALACAVASLVPRVAPAQDQITISTCPDNSKSPVIFEIDCSRLKAAASRERCLSFILNQACKVFPAYRKITGINLEQSCKSIKYSIYDKDSWPHKDGDAGGLALHCAVDYMAQYSVDGDIKMASGPYDTHELLHVYQDSLGALPYSHILFGPSQAEAMKLVGDAAGFERNLAQMKKSTAAWEASFQTSAARSTSDKCVSAEIETEETLYIEDGNNVYQFYRKLVRSRAKDMNDRLARFNRMYDAVSGGNSRQFLLAHGCPPF